MRWSKFTATRRKTLARSHLTNVASHPSKAIFYVCLFWVCICVIQRLGNYVVSKNCFGDAKHVVNINIYLSIWINYAHWFPGGFVVKDGKLEFIGVTKSAGDWVRSTLDIKLPVRRGCKIQQHHPSSGEEAWQIWYPKLNADDKAETASKHRTGTTSLKEVVATPGTYNVIAFTCTSK